MRRINPKTKFKCQSNKGSVLAVALIFGSFFLVVFTGLLSYVQSQRHLSVKKMQREEAFNVAEAGIEMYRWHIASELNGRTAQQVQAYWDGDPLGVPSYERDYKDPEGNVVGHFTMEVTPPEEGSTIIEVQTTGWHVSSPNVKRTIQARFRKPAWSEWVVVANDVMRFGEGTETWGPIHSNDGIRFDGVAHNLVSSSKETYWDPDTHSTKPGVWTSQADLSQVFLAGTQFPVPSVDFNGITADLNKIKENAQNGGVYLPETGHFDDGYHVILKSNGTMDIYVVDLRGSVSYSIYFEHFLQNTPIPENGAVFIEDDATIEGDLNDVKLTIVCANLQGGSYRNIYLEEDIEYAGYDGTELLGLIAQDDIKVGLYSDNNLRIDAALMAQNGNVGRDYYSFWNSPSYYKRDTITVYGALATNQRYGFAWVCSGSYCSGYENRNIFFDPELMYNIPPFFPTQNSYELDMWEEIQ